MLEAPPGFIPGILSRRFASVSQKLWQLFGKGRAYVAKDRRRTPEALRRAGRPQLRAQRSLTLDNPGHRSLAAWRERHERRLLMTGVGPRLHQAVRDQRVDQRLK